MLVPGTQVSKLQLKVGELGELYLVSPESREEVPTVLDRELLETCVVVVVCFPPTEYGENGM